MASRKTYFGIGLPKDPSDPESGPLPAPNATDQEDRSSPTVVDDERVAEGLKQLRSWYQEEGPHAANPPPARGQRTQHRLGRAPHSASGARVSGSCFSITGRARDAKPRAGRAPGFCIILSPSDVLRTGWSRICAARFAAANLAP